jgi:DNA-binding response OmpR family regulator
MARVPMARVPMAADDDAVGGERIGVRSETEGYDVIVVEDGTSAFATARGATARQQAPGAGFDYWADDHVAKPFGPREPAGRGWAMPHRTGT